MTDTTPDHTAAHSVDTATSPLPQFLPGRLLQVALVVVLFRRVDRADLAGVAVEGDGKIDVEGNHPRAVLESDGRPVGRGAGGTPGPIAAGWEEDARVEGGGTARPGGS